MSRPVLLAATLLFASTLGCSIETVSLEVGPSPRNECTENRDCGEGECVANQCRAREGSIESLLLEITPPAGSVPVTGLRFVESVSGLDPRGGHFSLALGHVPRLQGTVLGAPESVCADMPSIDGSAPSMDGSLPARITLTPRQRQLGVFSPSRIIETTPTDDGYGFLLAVSPGNYDIYVEPKGVVDQCAQPPQFFRNHLVEAEHEEMHIKLVSPQQLSVTVRWPHQEPVLDGWSLDVVDGETGRLLSTRAVLTDPIEGAEGLDYQVTVSYVPVQIQNGAGEKSPELVRLSPPSGTAAPQIIIDRTVLELFEEGQGVIDQLRSLPRPVKVTGHVSVENGTTTVAATVSLVATELRMISPGTMAAFEQIVETDAKGQFSVDLLPGTYRVVAFPPVGSALSPTEAIWQISANQDVQAGRVVELASSSTISARVLAPGRGVIAGAVVEAAAAAGSADSGVIDQALGKGTYVPRAEGEVTDADGRFSIQADRGSFDLWVRPGAHSGFSWLVSPRIDATSTHIPLGDLRMPLPVRYDGVVTSADLGSALVRAFAYLKGTTLTNEPSEATAVIQVAETRIEQDGTFQLMIPAHLTIP